MTIHLKALEEHFLMVFFSIQPFSGEKPFSESSAQIFSKGKQWLRKYLKKISLY
jgi:hypothetical protein